MHATLPLEATGRLPHSVPVLRQLAARGVSVAFEPGDSNDDFEARMETALMALFRDTRGTAEFDALYEYASHSLMPWIAAHVRDHLRRRPGTRDPLELYQDTWVNIFRYAPSFRDGGPASFRVWSRTIARNLYRAQGSRRRSTSLQAFPEGLQEPADQSCGPVQLSALREDARTLSLAWVVLLLQYHAAWQRLAPRDRIALELVEVQGLTYIEASARLSVGLSNMKMIMFRARKRLCAFLGEALGGTRVVRRAAG
jgi:DNA-directed RNA polymerase specialized sigma24 family protein